MYRKFYLLFLLSIFLFFEFFKFSFAEVREWGSYDYGFGSVTKEVPNNSRYRILTLDGGGIRGAFTAQILDMLEEELHFLQHVDFFAGTSTGAILACGLAYGISPKEIVEIFKTKGKDIFKVNRNILEILQLRPKYQIKSLKKALEDVFTPELTLSKLPKKVLCVSFDLYNPYYNNWTPALLDNFDSKASDQVSVVDAILRSTAAPTYFPSYQGYIDGGTIANNPTMMALTRALDIQGANQNLNNISLLSLGTGIASSYISGDEDWGTIEWMIKPSFNPSTPINPLIDILFDGTLAVPHYQCSRILGSAYFRFNAFLNSEIALDDWKKVDLLIDEAKSLPVCSPQEWKKLVSWVKKHFVPKFNK